MIADIHSHLLVGIDDGSRRIDFTASALARLSALGFDCLAFTPHFYPSRTHLDKFIEKRYNAFDQIRALPEARNFKFTLGAELYLTDFAFNLESMDELCYTGTRFILTELEYLDSYSPLVEEKLFRLMTNYAVTPVLAHIERYPWLISSRALLSQFRSMGCKMQVNLSALGNIFLRRKIFRAIDFGFVDFIGNDLHRSMPKETEFLGFFRKLEKKFGQGFLAFTAENAERMIFSARV